MNAPRASLRGSYEAFQAFSPLRPLRGVSDDDRAVEVASPATCLAVGVNTAEKMLMPHVPIRELHALASLYGVQTAYQDVRGDRQPATPEALLVMLRLLGAPVATFGDVPSALQRTQRTQWQRAMEPVG